MENFEIYVDYKSKSRKLNCTIEYESDQIMRISVKGNKRSILLECNYPVVKVSKNKTLKWQLKTPDFDYSEPGNAQFVASITTALRSYLRGDHKKLSQGEYLRINKT